jgi:hypothetical protein
MCPVQLLQHATAQTRLYLTPLPRLDAFIQQRGRGAVLHACLPER